VLHDVGARDTLATSAGHWVPHLMFYVPQTDRCGLGCGSARLPGYVESTISGRSEPVTVFMIPVLKWSDGTAAPTNAH